jgi:hypothetical protein
LEEPPWLDELREELRVLVFLVLDFVRPGAVELRELLPLLRMVPVPELL